MPATKGIVTRPEQCEASAAEPIGEGSANKQREDCGTILAGVGIGTRASTRVDRWLTAARLFKSRSQAQLACEAGHVSVNGVTAKPSRTIQIGDKIVARAPRGLTVVVVSAVEEKRQGAARARQLYDDQSPPAEREMSVGLRRRGAGRPTKADRRAIERLTGGEPDD
jgi:ribosome-associated heat shock protein Hsp15